MGDTLQKTHETQIIIIGAGVIGCAVAYELSLKSKEVTVLEKGPRIAEGITSRNSGVIHSGIYYPPGSLKAECCIEGNSLLYRWCEKKGVPHRKTGKWVVAQKESEENLHTLSENALNCGVKGIRYLSLKELGNEPNVRCSAALELSETGIVDPYEYSRSFQVAAEENQAQFILNTQVLGIRSRTGGGYELETSRGPVEADWVINCAGLYSDGIARLAGIDTYRIYPWRGDYFNLNCPALPRRLVYPVKKPGAAGLGVHLTLGLDGSARLGPDVELVSSKTDFSQPRNLETKRQSFFEGARTFLPHIQLDQLSYDSCGIRPKLRAPHEKEDRDFVLSQDLPGWVNLVGIESPGLTSAQSLAQRVAALLEI